MTKYRDILCETYDTDIGSVVGCGLEHLSRYVNSQEIDAAISFYTSNKQKINEFPIGIRRQAVEEFISCGMNIPSNIKT